TVIFSGILKSTGLAGTLAGNGGNGSHSVDLTGFEDGTVTVSISATDIAGNSTTGTGQTITLDTAAPIVSIMTPGSTTSQAVQAISGNVDILDAGATVKIYDNSGATPVATTTALGDGSWSTSVTLVSGTNSLVAKVTDPAGNTGTSNTVQFTLPSF